MSFGFLPCGVCRTSYDRRPVVMHTGKLPTSQVDPPQASKGSMFCREVNALDMAA
jgi:hypothetical protein